MRRAAGQGGYSQYGGGDAVIEGENDTLTDQLKGKIQNLKSLTIEIGTEVRDQNKYLKDMDNEFDNAGGFLGKAMGRVKKLAGHHQAYIAVYLFAFSLLVFLLIWLLTKIATS